MRTHESSVSGTVVSGKKKRYFGFTTSNRRSTGTGSPLCDRERSEYPNYRERFTEQNPLSVHSVRTGYSDLPSEVPPETLLKRVRTFPCVFPGKVHTLPVLPPFRTTPVSDYRSSARPLLVVVPRFF